MDKNILPNSIIKDNPTLRYHPWLEYVEGEDVFSAVDNRNNEFKDFLCKNVMYNDEIVELNGKISKFSEQDKPKLVHTDISLNVDNNIADKYLNIQNIFMKLKLSYDDILNGTIFTKTVQDKQYLIPLKYNDFYDDIKLPHMLEDWQSFSTILDFTKGVVYINDVLLNWLKIRRNEKFNIMCNILYNEKQITIGDDIYTDEILNDNGKLVLNYIEHGCPAPKFNIDFLPETIKHTIIENAHQFKLDDYMLSLCNMPYEIYSNMISNMNGTLYWNKIHGWFAQDKNHTAISVLTNDICRNGFIKPIVLKRYGKRLIAQDKTKLLIAQYLKFPTIPVLMYTPIKPPCRAQVENNVFESGQIIEFDENDPAIRQCIFPDLPLDIAMQIPIN